MYHTEYIIEFRSGTYFQSLEADRGGPRESAKRFVTKNDGERFMHEHEWILINGGMLVPVY